MVREIYQEYVRKWKDAIHKGGGFVDEWHFVKLNEEIVNQLDAPSAFEAIPEATQLLLEETDEYFCSVLLSLLHSLASKSNTTEVPEKLAQSWDQLDSHISKYTEYEKNQLSNLKRWYRLR